MFNRSKFVIMKAYHLTTSGRKLGLRKIVKEEPDCTLVVTTRHYGYGKAVPVYIIGCRADYDIKPDDETTYTVDTGNGYRNEGERLVIEHYLDIKGGEVIASDGHKTKSGELPDMEARYTFVMK